MKAQLLFLLEDIRQNKFYFIWNIIQISIVCILFSYILQSAFEYNDVKNKFDKMVEKSEIYMFSDQTADAKMDELMNEKKKLPKLVKLYESIEEKIKKSNGEVISFTADAGTRFYLNHELFGAFVKEFGLADHEYDSLELLSVSRNFFELFDLEVDGDLENLEKTSGKSIPIIVGNDFKKVYGLHDTICDYDGVTYEIVGFLKKDAYYIAPGETGEPISLNQFIIKLTSIDKQNSIDLMNYFYTTYYVANNAVFMEEVIEESRKEDLLDLSVNNFSHQMSCVTADMKDEIMFYGSIMTILFVFCIVAVSGNLLQFISNIKRELAIHMMNGASVGIVITRILMQLWVMFILAIIIVFLVGGISKSMVLSVLFSAVYITLLGLIPISVLKRQTIQTMLKKSYE